MLDEYKYPFIKSPEAELRRTYGSSIRLSDILASDSELLDQVKRRIKETVEHKKAKPYLNVRNPVLMFYTTLLALAAIKDDEITSKYINSEVEMFSRLMEKENEDDLIELSNILGFNVKRCEKVSYLNDKATVSLELCCDFVTYIRASKGTEAKLSKQILVNGYVYFNKHSLSVVLKKILRIKLQETLRPLKVSIPKTLEDLVKGRTTSIPPCIKRLTEKKEKESLTEEESQVLNAYLIDVGEKTDGSKVIVYSCKKMEEKGMCVANCRVKNPLQLVFRGNNSIEPLNHGNDGKDVEDIKDD